MNRLSLPKCHLLRASDLLGAIADSVRPELEAANITFNVNVPADLFCEAEQDHFVDSVIYVIELVKNHVAQASESPEINLSAALESGWLNVIIKDNRREIDRKAADTVAMSTAVNLYMEFDSNVGNSLTLSFPTSSPIEARQANQPVELPR